MTGANPRDYVLTPSQLACEVDALLQAAKSDHWRLVTTGHADLDAVVALYPGTLTGILGRPSHGKSMLCKAIARREMDRIRKADDRSACVVYVTLEEAPATVGMALGGWALPIRRVVEGDYDLAERRLAAAYLVKLPLFMIRHPGVVDGKLPPALTPSRLYGAIQSVVEDFPSDPKAERMRPTLVVLDYIQLLQADDLPTGEGARTATVTAAIEGAKQLAVQLGVPVVMAVQAARSVDSRSDYMPTMGDSQWASAIEQACDVVLGVHRPCRRDDLADQMRAGGTVHVTIGGRAYPVNDQLMVIGLVKQRAGIGYGRYPAWIDPVQLQLYAVDRHA